MNAQFDTLAFSHRLEAAGMNRKQSEAIASALQEVAMAEVATKTDIKDAVQTLTVRGFAASVTIVGVIAAIVKIL